MVSPLQGTQMFQVAMLRGIIINDEMLGPTLNVIGEIFITHAAFFWVSSISSKLIKHFVLEINDFMDALKWSREQARMRKEKRRAERVATLKWALTYPRSCVAQLFTRCRVRMIMSQCRFNQMNQSKTVAKMKHLSKRSSGPKSLSMWYWQSCALWYYLIEVLFFSRSHAGFLDLMPRSIKI